MNTLTQHTLHFYRRYFGRIAAVAIVLLAILFIQIGDTLSSTNWPQQWEFHQRIRFGRLNHGRPEVLYFHPNGAWAHVPYLSGVFERLHNNDSISKAATDTRLYVLRDSAGYRLTTQWAWNKTTRKFEFAGRDTTHL